MCNRRHRKTYCYLGCLKQAMNIIFARCLTNGAISSLTGPQTLGRTHICYGPLPDFPRVTIMSINDRLREHALSVRLSPSGNLAVHWGRCGCVPKFDNTIILARNRNKTTREITEVFFKIKCVEGTCVSTPSIALFDSEVAFLKSFEK
uniref:Putative tick transposon n=1 Tax=Ixodes ricinus TaxID=34613 RepID=A0A6B0UVG3_IXORI